VYFVREVEKAVPLATEKNQKKYLTKEYSNIPFFPDLPAFHTEC
jgi:hypothetical protein